jgi:hypothetical protein
MSNRLERVVPPALPLPSVEYSQQGQGGLLNVLRLFFTRLSNVIADLTSIDDGGRFLYMPRGLFYSTTAQTATLVNTGYPVEFENTYIGNGVSTGGVNNTRITVSADGVYNFQVTLMTQHTNSSDVIVWTWINQNGTDVPYGAKKQTIKGNSDQPIYWNFSIDVQAGQYIEMYWATDDTSLSLHTEAATAPHQGIPSALVAVSFVSNL